MENEGTVIINGRQEDCITLNSVFHVPCMKKNLFSIVNVVDAKNFVLFGPRDVKFLRNIKEFKANVVHTGKRVKDLFVLFASDPYIEKMSNNNNAYLWHARLGHLSKDKLKAVIKLKLVNGLPNLSSSGGEEVCEGCQFEKAHWLPFEKFTSQYKAPLELIHSDLTGRQEPSQFLNILICWFLLMIVVDLHSVLC